MKNQFLVSIIIPVYNAEKYIERSIDSALQQTYNNIEIIVTHNHATDADDTTSVLELYGANDSGPRYPIASIVCTGGKAEVVAGTDTTTWVQTMVVTSYHSKTITVTDSGALDRVARVTLDLAGIRYVEGLFTGGGSTSVITTAYVRGF